MPKKRVSLFVVVVIYAIVAAPGAVSFRDEQMRFPRVRTAAKDKDEALKQLFASKGLRYPPKAILFRAFKREAVLALWVEGASGSYTLAKNYSICATSGMLGPKRRFGDQQVPEGFYELDWFNPQSNFYLSLPVSYPNAADRVLGSKQNLGGDIFLHGNCVTIGCIPITDGGIKEVYWLAVLARAQGQQHIPIEIFPARLSIEELDQLASTHRNEPDLVSFWMNLKDGFDHFEKTHRPPAVSVDRGGRYAFSDK
jgi:murein L,D-transpeptidase YafK